MAWLFDLSNLLPSSSFPLVPRDFRRPEASSIGTPRLRPILANLSPLQTGLCLHFCSSYIIPIIFDTSGMYI